MNNLSDIKSMMKQAIDDSDIEKASELLSLWRKATAFQKREEELVRDRQEIENSLHRINGSVHPNWKGRKVIVEITPGAIKNSYMLVSGPIRKNILQKAEKLNIHVPETGQRFQTDIFVRNKHLRERQAIQNFYTAAKVQPGDFVILEETAPNEWTLAKCPPPGGTSAT